MASSSKINNNNIGENVVLRKKRDRFKSVKKSVMLHRPKSIATDILLNNSGKKSYSHPNLSSKPCLADILYKKKSRMEFHKFLASEYSAENLNFWSACDQFKLLKDHSDHQLVTARDIYDKYISPNSLCQINVDHSTRRQIQKDIMMEEVTKTTFINAQKYVYSIMENDSFPRFLQSSFYKGRSKSPYKWSKMSPF